MILNIVNKRLFYLVNLPRFVSILFLLEITIAIIFYPGGTYLDDSSKVYIFHENFLSDLGRLYSWNSSQNFISFFFFNFAFIQIGLTYIIFFMNLVSIFKQEKNIYYLSIIASIFGVLGGLFILGVGLAPADLYRKIHIIFAIWFIRFFFISSLLYILIFILSKKIKTFFSLGYVFYTIIIIIYILIGEFGPKISEGGEFALKLHVVSQKFIAFSSILIIFFQTIINKKLINK